MGSGGGEGVGAGGGAEVVKFGVEQFVLSKIIVCMGRIGTVPRKN